MPRPEVKNCTFSLDGREVEAPEGMMLVDAANAYGDVEIPVFCYDPKLVQPVGACRMCLVEIEGIPKLQTACSTPVPTSTRAPSRPAVRRRSSGRVPGRTAPQRSSDAAATTRERETPGKPGVRGVPPPGIEPGTFGLRVRCSAS